MPLDRSLKQDRLEQLRTRYNRSVEFLSPRTVPLESGTPGQVLTRTLQGFVWAAPTGGGGGSFPAIDGGSPSSSFGPGLLDGGSP